MKKRSLSGRLWQRLGVATMRALDADAARLDKRLDRADKRTERLQEILDQYRAQAASLAGDVTELKASAARLQQSLADTTDRADLLAAVRKRDLESLDAVAAFSAELEASAAAIEAHVDRVVARSVVSPDPFPHVVVDELLPADVYGWLLDELPPAAYWRSSGRSRDYWEIDTDVGPWRTEMVWRFVDGRIVNGMLRPRLLRAFGPDLARCWRDGFGIDPGCVQYHNAEGRLQLRRRGYQLRAHLDPPHAALTGLFYLARPGDDARYGTTLYRPSTPLPVRRQGIFYPEDHGITLDVAAVVPFKSNTLLVWMTSLGPHGADLTAADVPAGFERYTYQFQFVVDGATRRRIKAG